MLQIIRCAPRLQQSLWCWAKELVWRRALDGLPDLCVCMQDVGDHCIIGGTALPLRFQFRAGGNPTLAKLDAETRQGATQKLGRFAPVLLCGVDKKPHQSKTGIASDKASHERTSVCPATDT